MMKKVILFIVAMGCLIACKSQKNGHCDAYGCKPVVTEPTKG